MIRKATIEDIPRLVELGIALNEESTYKHVTYSPERVEATCKVMIEKGFLIVAEKVGEVVGLMMGDVHVPWYTTERMGFDYVLYISPEHRSGLIAMKMIKRFEEWCIFMGAKQIRPGIGTGIEGASRLYKALGYKVVGECFLKDVS